MKLSDFISETLLEISRGVGLAKSSEVWVAPGKVEGESVWASQVVEFDVAITHTSEGSGGINVFSFGNLNGSKSTEATNRIRFTIPVYFEAIEGKS